MNEGALDKRQVSLRVRIELVRKTVKSFGREEDGKDVSPSIVRALEEATRDVELTPEEYREIGEEIDRNRTKREQKRRNA